MGDQGGPDPAELAPPQGFPGVLSSTLALATTCSVRADGGERGPRSDIWPLGIQASGSERQIIDDNEVLGDGMSPPLRHSAQCGARLSLAGMARPSGVSRG